MKIGAARHTSPPSLIVDIGTATISGALVVEGAQPRIEKVERAALVSGSETAREALEKRLEPVLTELLAKFATHTPRHVYVVLAAPWYEATIRTITSESEEEKPISEKSVLEIVETYKNEKPPKSGNVDVEALAVQVKVNGYHTFLVRSVEGRSVAVNLYESETDATTEGTIRRAVEKSFPHATLSYHTFPLVASVVLRSLLDETSFAVVDIAGEVSELAIVYEDGIRHLSSFPIGYYSLARAFGGKKDEVADALSRLALYGRDELSEEEKGVVAPQFEKAMAPWLEHFEKAFKDASETIPIPQKLFIISDREHMPWLKKGIAAKNTFGLSLEEVTAPMVQNAVSLGEGGSYDVFLSLAALFFHTYKRALIGE